MSAIAGIINFNGKPVTENDLSAMMQPIAYWGPHQQGRWVEKQVGLGNLLLRNTPESRYESLPMKSDCGNYVITSHARIDNREELLSAFDVPARRWPQTPDSFLLLEAYLRWGESCVDHLLGDWVFALWDKRENKLFIARDQHGLSCVYYYTGKNYFLFCSSIKGILALPRTPRKIDEISVAKLLTAWPQRGDATIYRDIKRLGPANSLSLRINKNRNDPEIKRYWFMEHVPDIRYASDDQYLDAFMHIFKEAVGCRLRSADDVGVTLSGGLDSGSVAALAAAQLEESGRPLLAFSSAPQYDDDEALPTGRFNEKDYIKATASHIGNIRLSLVRSEHITPLAGMKRSLSLHGEPVHAASNQYWILALWEAARKEGVGTMLTGAGGNNTISWHGGGYLAQLFRQLRWLTLSREFGAWRRAHPQVRLSTVIKELILKPLVPLSLKQACHGSDRGRAPWEGYSAINGDFAQRLKLYELMREDGHDPLFRPIGDCRKMRLMGLKPGKSIVGCRVQQSGSGFGLEIRDPTLDRRVLEFCLGIPDDQYVRNGTDRYLIREAMAGLLPGEVLMNRKRGAQSMDVISRIRADVDKTRAALRRLDRSELAGEYLDLEKMRNVLNRVQREYTPKTAQEAKTILLRGLMMGMFLCACEAGSD